MQFENGAEGTTTMSHDRDVFADSIMAHRPSASTPDAFVFSRFPSPDQFEGMMSFISFSGQHVDPVFFVKIQACYLSVAVNPQSKIYLPVYPLLCNLMTP